MHQLIYSSLFILVSAAVGASLAFLQHGSEDKDASANVQRAPVRSSSAGLPEPLQTTSKGNRSKLFDQIERLTNFNPTSAFQFVDGLLASGVPFKRSELEGNIYYHWGVQDIEAATKHLRERNISRKREQHLASAILEGVLNKNPNEVGRLLELMPNIDYSIPKAPSWVIELNPDSALKRLSRIPAADIRQAYTENLYSAWAATDPKGALGRALEDFNAQPGILTTIIEQWFNTDPTQAESFVSTSGLIGMNDATSEAVALEYARSQDPLKAFQWIESIAGNRRIEALGKVVSRLDRANLHTIGDQISSMPDGTSRDLSIDLLAGAWARRDIPSALKWAQTLEWESHKEIAMLPIIDEWTRNDPGGAAKYVLSIGNVNPTVISAVATRLKAHDEVEFAEWLALLPSERKAIAIEGSKY